jgi:hypothetical protein
MMATGARLLLLFALLVTRPTSAGAPLFGGVAPVSDAELAQERGGFTLPNGVDVAVTAQTDTVRNGELILRSVFRIEDRAATMTVYAPPPGMSGPAAAAPVAMAPTSAAAAPPAQPQLMIDSESGSARVAPGPVVPPIGFAVGVGARPDLGNAPAGLDPIPLTAGGPAVATAAGTVSLIASGSHMRVVLDGHSLDVHHFVGQAFGTAVANQASGDRIDSGTWLNLDLRNTGPIDAASAAIRSQDVALDALRFRTR